MQFEPEHEVPHRYPPSQSYFALCVAFSHRCLDLSRVQFEPPEEVPPDPLQDGWAKGCALLDSESKRVVERILSDNGWERDQVVRPVEVLLKQLARCVWGTYRNTHKHAHTYMHKGLTGEVCGDAAR